jgi:hypothetical protein
MMVKIKGLILFFFWLFLFINMPGAFATQVFLTSGTSWTVPGGVTRLHSVEAIGAGGGGAYAVLYQYPVTPGNAITYQIGQGGAGGT